MGRPHRQHGVRLSGSQGDSLPTRRSRATSYSVLGLDFDGVIAINQPLTGPRLTAAQRLVRERVARLNTIVERTGCRVVVSSTWRYNAIAGRGFGRLILAGWLREAGYRGELAGITEAMSDESDVGVMEGTRGGEILAWCAKQEVQPRALAVLDDLELRGAVAPVLVRTAEEVGITDADVERVVALLLAKRPVRPWELSKAKRVSGGGALRLAQDPP